MLDQAAGTQPNGLRRELSKGLRLLVAAIAVAISALGGGAQASADDPVFGLWMVESGKAIVRIADCGQGGVCGSLVWLKEPRDGSGALKTDVANPNPALRQARLCGLSFINVAMRESRGDWRQGRLYSARDGKEYSVDLKSVGRNTLEVRGYVGFPLFGSSQRWTRVWSDRGGC